MRCSYDLEQEPLYTVKWYRGQFEFYRFTPKENPNTQIFSIEGLDVDVSIYTRFRPHFGLLPSLTLRRAIYFVYKIVRKAKQCES